MVSLKRRRHLRSGESKLPEIEQKLAEAKAMKQILEEGLRCACLMLDDCLRHQGSARAEATT